MDQFSNFMNLDLNVGPVEISSDNDNEIALESHPNVDMSDEDLFHNGAAQLRGVLQQRSHRWESILRRMPISAGRRSVSLELIGRNSLQIGEASATPSEATKLCENCAGYAEGKDLGRKKEYEKNSADEGSFFDCNICLDLATDPVVTCCGHMFCWPCLYRWLYHHSNAKKCPICKGGVTMKDVIPIYGRGSEKRELKLDSSLRIPPRPQACSIQNRGHAARASLNFPMDEVIRHLEDAYDMNRHITAEVHSRNSDGILESRERSLYHRVSNIRGAHRDQSPVMLDNDLNDTGGLYIGTDNIVRSNHQAHGAREFRRRRSAWVRRGHPHRDASPSNLNPIFTVDSYLNLNRVERNQEPERASMLDTIDSESHTVDNGVEFDSTGAHSALSSQRRGHSSRFLDTDSGDSPAPRWRRLN